MGLVPIYGIPFLTPKKERKKGVSFVKLNQTFAQGCSKRFIIVYTHATSNNLGILE
jgi:hypothetical protein